ncbi:formimidoylglutamate deiminase [Pelagibius litoralis]|uniref:Formimidoylglutamate deiminase n=1 Tax=Pelagibius litoralis TaxID=374515 RepID=A0A967C585_9PROT|nr:formimidoylglutamate deiminase [Pelagibius litoralis]NIA68964.1 formimidoylglutamate deiminase [Pelagibius litoralis]
MTSHKLFAEQAFLSDGWAENVLLEVDARGDLRQVTRDAAAGDATRLAGPVLPGMANLHSHAFQRAMAGLAEHVEPGGAGDDSFWTWREVMYRFVGTLTPEQVQAIAAQLYVEMLKSGYTAVGEFHYLHHGPDGQPYDDIAEMSHRTIAAAKATGIGITQLPVLYGYGGFGAQQAGEGQRRFLNNPNRLLGIVEALKISHEGDPQIRVGLAPHSLRAVTLETLDEAVTGLTALDPGAPIHLHIAEQVKEVEDCLAWSGRRPVEWLLENRPPDRRWCLVHATHMSAAETKGLAASGAVVGLCPTTEANLGDGLFPAADFLDAGGAWGIGSDSHISVSPVEELRWFEYGQRLATRRRNVLAGEGAAAALGHRLYSEALAGGAQALGRPIGALEAGRRADLVVLDPATPALSQMPVERLLDATIFAGNCNPVRDVMVGGDWVVCEGSHRDERKVLENYRVVLKSLLS